MSNQWLPAEFWAKVQQSVPIVCVDVLAIQIDRKSRALSHAGLIWRNIVGGKQGWCLIGGRLLRDESLAEAITRQVRETLGKAVTFTLPEDPQPVYFAQYFTSHRAIGATDPRQHAMGLTFAIEIAGEIHPQGEALDFKWFELNRLPAAHEFGFGQDRIVGSVIERLIRRP
jgi:ADP-ribose pyrophosphatase YjhB (NUDIX family)